VVDAGLARQREGWTALGNGDRQRAEAKFAAALWADADSADAWLGYGLSVATSKQAIGALAIAILLYPDAATARARRAQVVPAAASGDVRRQHELEAMLDRAGNVAERLRTRLPPGTVRLAEPFSWGAK
jgi:thioredoxin-like negative regulator of GroEL